MYILYMNKPLVSPLAVSVKSDVKVERLCYYRGAFNGDFIARSSSDVQWKYANYKWSQFRVWTSATTPDLWKVMNALGGHELVQRYDEDEDGKGSLRQQVLDILHEENVEMSVVRLGLKRMARRGRYLLFLLRCGHLMTRRIPRSEGRGRRILSMEGRGV